MDRFVVLSRVLDDAVHEGDAALLDPVGELELMENRELVRRLHLCRPARLQRIGADVRTRNAHLRCGWRRRAGTAARADERRTERQLRDEAP